MVNECKIPNDCWGCSEYNDCPDLEKHKEKGPDKIFLASFCLSLATGAGILYAAIKWIQYLFAG